MNQYNLRQAREESFKLFLRAHKPQIAALYMSMIACLNIFYAPSKKENAARLFNGHLQIHVSKVVKGSLSLVKIDDKSHPLPLRSEASAATTAERIESWRIRVFIEIQRLFLTTPFSQLEKLLTLESEYCVTFKPMKPEQFSQIFFNIPD